MEAKEEERIREIVREELEKIKETTTVNVVVSLNGNKVAEALAASCQKRLDIFGQHPYKIQLD